MQGVLNSTLCDKVCSWLATGRWFSPGTPVSSTNKTDSHDITEILLKNAVNTIKSTNQLLLSRYFVINSLLCVYSVIMFSTNVFYKTCSHIWTSHVINKWNTNKPVFRHQLTFKRKQHNRISYLRNVKHFLPFLLTFRSGELLPSLGIRCPSINISIFF
jgi:hypothetical protein